MTARCQERIALDEVLESLCWQDGEFTAICHRPVGEVFASAVVKSVDASAMVKSLPDRGCVWFSVNPTSGPERQNNGRGGERGVTRWAGLYLDLDVKEGSFPDLDKAIEFVSVFSGFLGSFPSVEIHSGHGLQPVWAIENGGLDTEERSERAYRLIRRFGRLATRVASDFEASLDNVFDLARILRVPGTTNWKDPANPAEVYAVRGSGAPLTIDQVEAFLDEWAPEIDSDRPVRGDAISSPDSWKFGVHTCAYVTAMVRSWCQESDRPEIGRHQWAMSRCVRLAAAHRLGCITRRGLDQALVILESALKHWCQVIGVPRDLAPHEVGSAYRWAEARVATFNHRRARSELGHHQHSPVRGRTWTLVRA